MPSKAELILNQMHIALNGLAAQVERNTGLPEDIPPAGLVVLHDGDPGEPDVLMSPLTYVYEHRAEINVFVQGEDDLNERFDDLRVGVGEIIRLDRTLGGLCDWVEAESPRQVDFYIPGAAPVKAATIAVMLHYGTGDPLA